MEESELDNEISGREYIAKMKENDDEFKENEKQWRSS